ncbi:MAG: D-aminoacyl-tRNA deacylase [Oscillospiraceae bacterium]
MVAEMKLVIQRVKNAVVTADGIESGKIEMGLLVLIGVIEGDTSAQSQYLADKTAQLRIFTDEQDKLNLSVQDIQGSILVVSNFTLGGDCKKGNRPSFIRAAKQPNSEQLYLHYVSCLKERGIPVKTGVFGAHMEILMNALGPITIVMDTEEMGR